MLVFTQYRDTASHLVSELNTFSSVRVERFVGQASKPMDKGLTQEEQAERIKSLEEGILNVLVATSIAEEGLDIPAVDHVIFYEPIPSEIRYIQRRGRTGRKYPGKVTILVANDSLDMIYLYASRRRTEKMRRIAKNVNSKLQPIIRTHMKPTPNPLTPMEIKVLEAEAKQVKTEPEIIETEVETLSAFRKKVERTARRVYTKLLERGVSGANIDQLALEMELEGVTISTSTLRGAIEKLMKDGFVTAVKSGSYATTSAVKVTGKTYKVTIEKIHPESAIVIIDDEWRARLIPEEYNGPRNIIKKNSSFRASAQLYRLDGTLNIRVKEVTEIL